MADVEAALMVLLDELGYTVTTTPADLEARLPVIRIRRVGGGGDQFNDAPRVSVQAFAKPTASDPRAHVALAQQIEDVLYAKVPGAWVDGVCLDSVDKDSGPVELTYPSPAVRVSESVFRITTRR